MIPYQTTSSKGKWEKLLPKRGLSKKRCNPFTELLLSLTLFFFFMHMIYIKPRSLFQQSEAYSLHKEERKEGIHPTLWRKNADITKGIYTTSRSLASWKLVLEKFRISCNLLVHINFTVQVLHRSSDQNHLLFGLLFFGTTVITVYIVLHIHS